VQHSGDADVGAKVLGIAGNGGERLGCGPQLFQQRSRTRYRCRVFWQRKTQPRRLSREEPALVFPLPV
jgi:hypothetical protein